MFINDSHAPGVSLTYSHLAETELRGFLSLVNTPILTKKSQSLSSSFVSRYGSHSIRFPVSLI